jgi:chromosome segregation protein
MHLNHLVLQGYKSFATKTEFLFPTGITAIVGPNGSGKSNVADAIRWVLGEQRMRTLRAKSTGDMIFVGGRRRARAGMAEVSLTFDNSDAWLPIEFSEVTITRRAYRSGENEYLVNGSQVRLRDIVDLLAESGLGQRAYTIIGQGLVDAALSLRPQERRTLFEDAAGIGLYRSQRQEAIQRLDETQRNLERVHDIVSEITPRLRRLEKDVEQVEEHRRLSAHLQRLQRTWYGHRWGQLQAALDQALQIAETLESDLKARQREEAAMGERLILLRQQESELRASLRDWHRESADFHDEMNKVRRELAVTEERSRLLEVRRQELLAELGPMGDQYEAQAEKVAQTQAQVGELERDLMERRERLAVLEQEWAGVAKQAQEPVRRRVQVEQELRTARAQAERLNQALLDARAKVAHLESEQAIAVERARQLASRHDEALAELGLLTRQQEVQVERVALARQQVGQLEESLAEQRQQVVALERKWQAVRQQALGPESRRTQVEQDLGAQRLELERLNQTLLETRAEMARLSGEQEATNRMRAEGDAYDAGVHGLLGADLEGVLGPLAALIRVPREWERAIGAAVGADLQAVVLERSDILEDVRRILESVGGWLTLLPLDSLRQPPPLPAGILRAADVVDCDGRVRPAVEAILGTVALCDDVETARALLQTMPWGSRCVTAAGAVLRSDGALSLGRAGAEGAGVGFLAAERTRRELAVRLAEAQRQHKEIGEQQRGASERVAALEAELADLERRSEEAREQAIRAEQTALSQAQTQVAVAEETCRNQRLILEREAALLEQLRAQATVLRHQANELEDERAALASTVSVSGQREVAPRVTEEAEADSDAWVEIYARDAGEVGGASFRVQVDAARRHCEQIEERQQAAAAQITALETRLETLIQQADAAREETARVERETVGQARTGVAVVEEAHRSQQASLERELAMLDRLQAQIAARRQRLEELEIEQAEVAARIQELHRQMSRVEEQQRQVHLRIQPAEDELARLRQEETTLEEEERRIRDRVRDMEARQGRAQLEVERCRDELKLMGRRIEEDLGLVELELSDSVTAQSPLPLRPVVSQLPVVEQLPAGLEEEIQRLKARLHRLRGVNPNALEEHAEVQERHRFLTEQSADLEAASIQLRQVVAELDELMATAFRETFDAVAAKFSDLFPTLFNGGSARLELTEPDDLLNTGVDIVARPPGKRAQRLALLSGGERALTANALLFSILSVSPTPFCVLDEVDAMLDEANVGRFRAVLEEFAQETQFIVITHNRVTTEAGHTIYGVSMGADAVSQVVSLKLD